MKRESRVLWSLLTWMGLAIAGGTAARAQSAALPAVYAIVGARIEIGDGRIIEKGTVLVRDGLIEAVGATIAVPPDAEIIKGDGLIVYPGFLDAHCHYHKRRSGFQSRLDRCHQFPGAFLPI